MTDPRPLFHTHIVVDWSARSDRSPEQPRENAIWWAVAHPGGAAAPGGKPIERNPVTLRLNVRDVEASAAALEARGVRVVIRREFWGTVGDFVDPDGNRCALRDEDSFPPPLC